MIYLVRHGQTDWNKLKKLQGQTDIPLNEVGKQEALSVANSLNNIPLEQIISSDLSRAVETAKIINQNFKLPLLTDNRLREVNYGDLEGKERETLSPAVWETFQNTPEKLNAEKLSDVYHRIKSFFDEVDLSKNTLIVTHGGALRLIMYYAKHKETFDKKIYNQSFKDIMIQNATVLKWDENTSVISKLFD
jgi:probable phosphoglycerate mutase